MAAPEPLRVRMQRAGRAGKTVTRVEGLRRHPDARRALLGVLKKKLGTGGTERADALEIQGDQRDRLVQALTALGHRVSRAN